MFCVCVVLLCPTGARGLLLGSVAATQSLRDEWTSVLGSALSGSTDSNLVPTASAASAAAAAEFVSVSVAGVPVFYPAQLVYAYVPASTQPPLPPSVERYVCLSITLFVIKYISRSP